MDQEYYIGLMTGTSADGLDGALVQFDNKSIRTVASHSIDFAAALQQAIIAFNQPGDNEINRLGELSVTLGKLSVQMVKTLLQQTKLDASQITAIGSHGQNIRHQPNGDTPFTLQIADPTIIAAETGITTVADFRRKDMALGGQGAPLAPALHHYLFQDSNNNRVVINIGGIANITHLPSAGEVIGFDTGPGNSLMNAWCQQHLNKAYDNNGAWAQQGQAIKPLLNTLLKDSYFTKAAPKSTGREYFNLAWLQSHLSGNEKPQDVQASLLALTTHSIVNAINALDAIDEVIVCGGGVHNAALMQQLQNQLAPCSVMSSQQLGVDPDVLEAVLFAWLARQTIKQLPGNLPAVTGATRPAILGGIYYP